ncbi:MAG: hypothetical protein A2145_06675 [candidate division Zixibacteria bacterium RBG_16_40_9]|nr:MAG: hypothetical protein A2145_06675 [candidate division Zixibacteria bacterium RBG_16_40_9]
MFLVSSALFFLSCSERSPTSPFYKIPIYELKATVTAKLVTEDGQPLIGTVVEGYYFSCGTLGRRYSLCSSQSKTNNTSTTEPALRLIAINNKPIGYFELWAVHDSDSSREYYSVETYSFKDRDSLNITAVMRAIEVPTVGEE